MNIVIPKDLMQRIIDYLNDPLHKPIMQTALLINEIQNNAKPLETQEDNHDKEETV